MVIMKNKKRFLSKVLLAVLVMAGMLHMFPVNTDMGMQRAEAKGKTVQFGLCYHEPTKSKTIKIPVGYQYVIQPSDAKYVWYDDFEKCFSVADKEIVSLEYAPYITALKEGSTTVHYKRGSNKGKLTVKVVPKLDIETVSQSAEISNGKIQYKAVLKNNSNGDIVIQGFNVGGSLMVDDDTTEFLGLPWAKKKVTLKAGMSKSISFTCNYRDKAAKKVSDVQPPTLYLKYQGVYFLVSLKDKTDSIQWNASYYGNVSFAKYLKNYNDD